MGDYNKPLLLSNTLQKQQLFDMEDMNHGQQILTNYYGNYITDKSKYCLSTV